MRNSLLGDAAGPAPLAVAGDRLHLDMNDASGDRLAAVYRPGQPGKPLVVLVHGLTGCEASTYMLNSAAHFIGLGYPVLRLNLRGAGPSRASSRGHYHAGKTEDLQDALLALDPATLADGLLLVGYSLGANMLLKFLAELGREIPVRGAASVSAPIDLAATANRFMQPRNTFYHRWLLSRMKADCLSGAVSETERAAVEACRSVYGFDDVFVAPHFGFGTADAYYAACSATAFIGRIETPTLVIHARDDPWIPADAYLAVDWDANPNLTPAVIARGGHCGFHDQAGGTWHDRTIAAFFDALR